LKQEFEGMHLRILDNKEVSDLTKDLVLAHFCQTCTQLPVQKAAEKAQEYVVKISSIGSINTSSAFLQQVLRLALRNEQAAQKIMEEALRDYFLCVYLHKSHLVENLKTKPAEPPTNEQLARVPLSFLCKLL
jgi:hypothetical protein